MSINPTGCETYTIEITVVVRRYVFEKNGMEFNDDGKVNHELLTYEDTDDFKDRKLAAKVTADRKAVVAALPKTEAIARTEARVTTAAISIAATKAATATAAATEAARRQQVEAAVAAALGTPTPTTATEGLTEPASASA